MYKKISENLYYIGVIDKELKVFDVIMETKYGSSYNSYLYQTKEHNILIETVKVNYFDEYLHTINELVGIENIDTIIVNHTEPDHVGSIEKLLELNPTIEVIGSKAAILYLKDITNKEFKNKTVKPNEVIPFNDKSFQFISVPFLHWPDSIYTYIKEEKALFTCDSFGSHYAFDEVFLSRLDKKLENDYMDAYQYYYDSIFSPYKKFVLQAIEKIKDLTIDTICTGHGPIIDRNIQFYLDSYKEWSTKNRLYEKLIVIPYATSYGYTEMIAEKIVEGIKQFDDSIEVKLYNLNVLNYRELEPLVVEDMYHADAVFVGSTTINKDATPIIWDLVTNLSPMIHQGLYATTFGSYGWSGEGVNHIQDRLKSLGLKVLPSLKLKFKPSINDEIILVEYGRKLAEAIFTDKNEITMINNSKMLIYN